MTNFSLANYQSFTIDKSLVKKVFAKKATKTKASRHVSTEVKESEGSNTKPVPSIENSEGYLYEPKQKNVHDTLKTR